MKPFARAVGLSSRVVNCVVGAGLALVWLAGCGGRHEPPADAAVLDSLKAYNPEAETDGRGRVVSLKLEGRHVDDLALDSVGRLPELKTLSLHGSSVTDNGLAKLAGAIKLQALGLGKTGVTRRGLTHLERLPALQWVWLTENTKLRLADIEDFKKRAVPGVTVYR